MKKTIIITCLAFAACTLSIGGCASENTTKEEAVSSAVSTMEPEQKQSSSDADTLPDTEGSGSASAATEVSFPSSYVMNDEIHYEDIAWSVDQGQYNGKEFCLFSYTNNSPFIITDLEMRFAQKEDTTEEQRAELFGELKEKWNMTDEDIANLNLDGYTKKIADPGETITDKPMYLNSFYGPTDYDMYSIMEPRSIKVSFLGSDRRIHSGEIDCQSGKYRDNGKTIAADQWSESTLAQMLPKPDSPVISVSFDRDDVYWAYAYGMTSVDYENHIEACQELGFNVDVDTFDFPETSSFYADDAVGNRLNVDYDSMNEELSINLSAYEPEGE